MRCRWTERGDRDARGVGTVYCARPGCPRVIYQTPNTADEIQGDYSCNAWPERHEFGEWIGVVLSWFYISRFRYVWFKHKLGMKPRCKCPERAAALNTLGSRLNAAIGWLYAKIGKLFTKRG